MSDFPDSDGHSPDSPDHPTDQGVPSETIDPDLDLDLDPDLDPDLDLDLDPDLQSTDEPLDLVTLSALHANSGEPDLWVGSPSHTGQVYVDRPPRPGHAASRVTSSDHHLLGLLIAIVAAIFVFSQLRPGLLFTDNTPAGGDMGAHVWGPAYLRDQLLASGRLTGWTNDWYAGFPAYHFYMVVPALAVIALNNGFAMWVAVPIAVALVVLGLVVRRRFDLSRGLVWTIVGLLIVLTLGTPYGIAFKLVSVTGLVMFPIAVWGMARLADCREPIPGLCAIAALVFLFDTNFTIYGGNIASTLAGEFAFSLSLCLSMLVIGYVLRGMDDGKWRASAAVLISLVALCHVIPLFFMVVALMIAPILHHSVNRLWLFALGVPMTLVPLSMAEGNNRSMVVLAVLSVVIVLIAVALGDPVVRTRAAWLAITGPVAGLLAAFWLVPFYVREPYFNDMGWERRNDIGAMLLTTPMRWLLPLAVVGAVLAIAARDRIGMVFAVVAPLSASGVAYLPEGKLWNARLTPFYYLSVYLLVAVGVGLIARFCGAALSERLDRPDWRVVYGTPIVALLVALVGVALPLRILPGGGLTPEGTYEWLGLVSNKQSVVPGWAKWNYSGYEAKASFREYHDVVDTMAGVGRENGCGRAMWEYNEKLDRYGTPMALMLLPFWTEGCIASMEGLYFESSATTPFHFINQSLLSEKPSRAQRDLPYQAFDVDTGVDELQLMGVRYYLALSDLAIAAARDNPALVEIARSEPWAIFEVADSELVEGLRFEPVVASGPDPAVVGDLATRFDVGWVSQAVAAYSHPSAFTGLPAEDGPVEWARVDTLRATDGRTIAPATVTDIVQSGDSISFSVDEPGRPVLVKVSYFPNWKVSGAEGPWRIGPNLMVVVPTGNDVRLSYGWTVPDIGAHLLSLAGIVALVALARRDRQPSRYL